MSVERRRGCGDGVPQLRVAGQRGRAAPDGGDPARLQLQQREVRSLCQELPDNAEAGKVRVEGPLVQREVRTETTETFRRR